MVFRTTSIHRVRSCEQRCGQLTEWTRKSFLASWASSGPLDYQSSGKSQLGAFLIFGIARTGRSPYPTPPAQLKAFRIFIDPFPGYFQAVTLRGCLIRKCACTLEPHDFYRPSARLDNTHRSARRPTIGSPHPRYRTA
jgi:hypothetical protein